MNTDDGIDVEEMSHIMHDAERASIYYKHLVMHGVPTNDATSITGMWVATWIRAMTEEPPHRPEPWDEP